MAKKKKCPECPAGEKWAVPYADFLSLLLALFIALYAISAVNTAKVEALKEEFIKIFDFSTPSQTASPIITMKPDSGEKQQNTQTSQSSNNQSNSEGELSNRNVMLKQGGILEEVDDGVSLKLPSSIKFSPNAYAVENQDEILYIRRMAEIIKTLPPTIKVDIRGYSGDSKLTEPFTSYYQLAGARALNVLEHLLKFGVNKDQLIFTSYGDNSAKNVKDKNRVEIYLKSSPDNASTVEQIISNIPAYK